ncbi:hypothetical protein TorRG33x02_021170, partial [Trema orientale]
SSVLLELAGLSEKASPEIHPSRTINSIKRFPSWFCLHREFVLKGLLLTTVATLCLTSYTFWAARKSKDLRFLEPLISVHRSRNSLALCGLVAPVLLFSNYTLYNTNELMDEFTYGYLLCIEGRPRERYPYDDYILATITLGNNLMIPVVAILSVWNVVASMRKLRESCISC